MSTLIVKGINQQDNTQAKLNVHQKKDASQIIQQVKRQGEKASQGQQIQTNEAAVFSPSKLSHYDVKKLSTLQKNIMKINEQIQKVQEDTSMDESKKDDMLKTLNEMLEGYKQQLEEEKSPDTKADDTSKKDQKSPDDKHGDALVQQEDSTEQLPLKETTTAIISADLDRKLAQSLNSQANKTKSLASVKQRDLYFSMHHPAKNPSQSPLVLKDPALIAKIRDEIKGMKDSAQAMQESAGEALHDHIAALNKNDEATASVAVHSDDSNAKKNKNKGQEEESLAAPEQRKPSASAYV